MSEKLYVQLRDSLFWASTFLFGFAGFEFLQAGDIFGTLGCFALAGLTCPNVPMHPWVKELCLCLGCFATFLLHAP